MLEGAGYKLPVEDYLAMADAAEGRVEKKTLSRFRDIVQSIVAAGKAFKSKRERMFFGHLVRRIEKAAAKAQVEDDMGLDEFTRMASGGRMFRAAEKRLAEDSPLEGPVGGYSRDAKFMNPKTRELVLRARETEISAFAEDRGFNPAVIWGICEASMRLGRVPNLGMYGIAGDDAKVIKNFIAGDILNVAVEDLEGAEPVEEGKAGVAMLKKKKMGKSLKRVVSQAQHDNEITALMLLMAKKRGEGFITPQVERKVDDIFREQGIKGIRRKMVMIQKHLSTMGEQEGDMEESTSAGMGAHMKIGSAFLTRPASVIDISKWEKTAEEQKALPIQPRLGVDMDEKPAYTIEDLARMSEGKGAEPGEKVVSPCEKEREKAWAKMTPEQKAKFKGKDHPHFTPGPACKAKYSKKDEDDLTFAQGMMESGAKKDEKDPMELGKGGRFKALVAKFKARGDVKDPEALAAKIGQRKYGAKKMAKWGAAEKKRETKMEQGPPEGAPRLGMKAGKCPFAKSKKDEKPEEGTQPRGVAYLREGEKWIKGAIKQPGALHKALGVPEGEKIPKGKIKKAAKKSGKVGQEARLAMTLAKLRPKKESSDGNPVDAAIQEAARFIREQR